MRVAVLVCALVLVAGPARAADAAQQLAALAPPYLADLPRLKALKGAGEVSAPVAVFADYGVWSGSARAVLEAVRARGGRARAIDRADLNDQGLAGVKLLIVPGGLAPFQWQAAGTAGLAAIGRWVRGGGRLVGLCAGAYLVSHEVRYMGQSYTYPLGLFDGAAVGPVPGLAAFPAAGPVKLAITEAGKRRGLGALEGATLAYGGGPSFEGGTGAEVLARFPDGSAAVVARACGRGEIVLSGAHVELAAGATPWAVTVHPRAAELMRALAGAYP